MMRNRQDVLYAVVSLLRDVMRAPDGHGSPGLEGAVFPLPDIRGISDIAQDLGLDAIAVLEFMRAVEATFGLEVPPNDVRHLKTVDAVVDRVMTHLATGGTNGPVRR